MFYFIDIYSFIPVSGCVGMGPNALIYPGPTNLLLKEGPDYNNLATYMIMSGSLSFILEHPIICKIIKYIDQ
jgi:hypothetical protein